jgi:hypothetical protein
MKDQTKVKKQTAKEVLQVNDLIIDDSLMKFSGSEFAPEKLKKVERKFNKQVAHN